MSHYRRRSPIVQGRPPRKAGFGKVAITYLAELFGDAIGSAFAGVVKLVDALDSKSDLAAKDTYFFLVNSVSYGTVNLDIVPTQSLHNFTHLGRLDR